MIDLQPPRTTGTELTMLADGHGWAGLLYATLTWCEATGSPAPDRLPDRLDQLAALGNRTAGASLSALRHGAMDIPRRLLRTKRWGRNAAVADRGTVTD